MKKIIITIAFMLPALITFPFGKSTEVKEQKDQVCITVEKSVKKITSVAKTGVFLYFFRDIVEMAIKHAPDMINALRPVVTQTENTGKEECGF